MGMFGATALVVACNTADVAQAGPAGMYPTPSPTAGDDDDAGNTTHALDGGKTTSGTGDSGAGGGGGSGDDDDSTPTDDGGADTSTPGDPSDGTPTRLAQCTSTFGNALTSTHGRMDGYLVQVVAPTTKKGCNADNDHVHLQVKIGSDVYDVAVNVDGVLTKQLNHALLDGAWAEGWHPGDTLDFVSDLGLHDTDFTSVDLATAVQEVQTLLANANHVSFFATGYGPDGAHLVHRNGNGNDGALIVNPLSANPTWLVFHFPEQTF